MSQQNLWRRIATHIPVVLVHAPTMAHGTLRAYPRLGWCNKNKKYQQKVKKTNVFLGPWFVWSFPCHFICATQSESYAAWCWTPSPSRLLPRSTTVKTHFQLSQSPGFGQIFRLLQSGFATNSQNCANEDARFCANLKIQTNGNESKHEHKHMKYLCINK